MAQTEETQGKIETDASAAALVDERERAQLERTWERPRGFFGWFTNTNHKDIAMRYIVTAFIFFLLAGIEAALMRIQLSRPENRFLGPDLYNQIFTTHGTTMMFLFAVPMMEGIGLYFVPLMVGTRNVAFPRLNAFGYYTYLIGGLLIYIAFLLNVGPDAGWFAYVPLSGPGYSPGKRVDIWAQMITFTEIAALVGAVEIVTTVFKQRAPGMSLNRIPLFVWSQVVTAFMIIFAMPAVMLASSFLAADRLISTHFFNPAEGFVAVSYPYEKRPGEAMINVNKIVAIDVASDQVVATYDAGVDPENFVISPAGTRFYIANEDVGVTSIVELSSGRTIATLVVGAEPEGVVISPNGRWVYVTSESASTVSVIDTQINQVVKTFLVGARPRDGIFSLNGTQAYITAENGGTVSVVDAETHTVIDTVQLPRGQAKPKGVVISGDGQRLYVATGRGNSVAVIDTASRQLLNLIPVGKRPWGIAISPDNKRVYAANGLSNDVSVIDAATNQVVASIKAGDGPWGIVIKP